MNYVISDIHGCYDQYKDLLEKIHFSDEDTLYVLGDVVDRGPEPLKVLLDMSMRPNVIPIMGNHEYMALSMLKKAFLEDNKENFDKYFNTDYVASFNYWLSDGGNTTLEQFKKLSEDDREFMLEYLEEFEMYDEVFCNGRRYLLVHADIAVEDKDTDPDLLGLQHVLFTRADYQKRYSDSYELVTGHTPTFLIDPKYEGRIYMENHHIAVDCGCVYGKRLGAYCFETGECFYSK